MKKDWYESFFEGIVLDLWRQAVSPEQTRLEADFLERVLKPKPGARVLDVPCGLGRHSLELASRGFRMTGVDLSSEAIQEARQRSSARSLDIEWVHADMRELPWPEAFDGGFCLGNSFGYFDADSTRGFVEALSGALKPGARCVLDCSMAAECSLPRLVDREWTQIGDILFLEENRYDVEQSCVETTYTLLRSTAPPTFLEIQRLAVDTEHVDTPSTDAVVHYLVRADSSVGGPGPTGR